MMKKQKPHQKPVTKPQQKQEVAEKSLNWIKLAVKMLLLFAVVVSVVAYTDWKEYFVGDQTNNHTERKWRSFYRFAEMRQKNADIVVFGNSHASAGVEPYIVSMATGTYCFILNTPGSAAVEAYFNLEEILANNNTPKVVILETSCLDWSDIGREWSRIQSFDAKKNSWRKWKSMPFIFSTNEWVKALSPTVRNHSFLLTDTDRIRYNIENVGKEKNPDRNILELGRFSHGSNYLQDSTLVKYDVLGAPVKCENSVIHENQRKYLIKLYDLCMKNHIELMLLTVPMYYKTFDNYSILKAKYTALFREIPQAKWLDLQHPYDSVLYTPKAFNNEFNGTQHNSYYGMTISAYKISQFIMENYGNILPDRKNEDWWVSDFKSQDHFVFNHDVIPEVSDYFSIEKNRYIGALYVRELAIHEIPEANRLILKIDKHPDLSSEITIHLKIEYQNHIFVTPVAMQMVDDVFPPKHNVYVAFLRKDMKILGFQ